MAARRHEEKDALTVQAAVTEGHPPFDDLAKELANDTISRRQALKYVGALALGAALLPLFPHKAQALSKKKRRKCHRSGGTVCGTGSNEVCCGAGTTCCVGANGTANCCATGTTCQLGVCTPI